MPEHSILAPSSAHRWGKRDGCPASVTMAMRYTESSGSEAAREGTAAHELAERLISAYQHGKELSWQELDGQSASNGALFSEEMYDAASIYANHVRSVMIESGVFDGANIGVETRLKMSGIHPLMFGTADCFVRTKGSLHIWDFKYGHGEVDAYENMQLISYYAGLAERFKTLDVEFHIIQPRAYSAEGSIKTWLVSASDLGPYLNELRSGAEASLTNDPVFRSGPHCKYCPGLHHCETALKAGFTLYEESTRVIPRDISPVNKGVALAMLERAKQQIGLLVESYSQEIQNEISCGNSIPGYTLNYGRASKKWTKTVGELKSIDGKLVTEKALTPAQAIKLVGEKKVEGCYEVLNGKLKLARDDGKAMRVFK